MKKNWKSCNVALLLIFMITYIGSSHSNLADSTKDIFFYVSFYGLCILFILNIAVIVLEKYKKTK